MALIAEPREHTSTQCDLAPNAPCIVRCVEAVASASNRPFRPLQLQTLLQAPRLAGDLGSITLPDLQQLVAELAEELPPTEDWVVPAVASPHALSFGTINSCESDEITRRFHYLRSPRTDGSAYALRIGETGPVVALCVISPLDIPHLQELLRTRGRSQLAAKVVSRVFAFEGAPRNSLSHLLSRVCSEERRRGASDLVTYVNPNLGFTGVSYRASGWSLLGDEPGTTYRYLDSRYVTDRELSRRFGQRSDSAYRQFLGSRYAVSRITLQPLLVFHTALG